MNILREFFLSLQFFTRFFPYRVLASRRAALSWTDFVWEFFSRHASRMLSRIPKRRCDSAAEQERPWQTNAPRQLSVTLFHGWDGEACEKGDETGRRTVKSAVVEWEESDRGRAAEDGVGGRGVEWKVEDRGNRAQVDKGHVSRHPSTQPFIDYSRTMAGGDEWRGGGASMARWIRDRSLLYSGVDSRVVLDFSDIRHKIGNSPWYDFFRPSLWIITVN